jgi:hypothetical protein
MQDDVINVVKYPVEAQRWLGVTAPTYNALLKSGLLGRTGPDNSVVWEDLQHYERYGTQWQVPGRPPLPTRMVPAEFIQSMPPPPDIGDEKYPGVQTWFFVGHESMRDFEEALETDTGWLAHFYLTPNPYLWPAPTSTATVGPMLLKLRKNRMVLGAKLRTVLYPDPTGSLGLVTVFAPSGSLKESLETAYSVAGPVLDELSVEYDQPLPISHALAIGIPSGLIVSFSPWMPEIRTLEPGHRLLPRCPHPELKHAVALYREGVSSNSPFHQFLTLWKVYENACEVRGKWRRQHKRHVIKVEEEVIPKAFAFGGYEGKTFEDVRQELNDAFRVALAHGGDSKKGGEPKTAASAEDYLSVVYAVPVMRYIASVTLKNVRATLDSTQRSSA